MKKLIKGILGRRITKFLKTIFPLQVADEPREVVAGRQNFYRKFINAGDLVFDVGANLGNRTRPLLNIGAKLVAIEPQKECYKVLRKKFGNSIEIVTMGVGEREEIKDFFVADVHTISSFSTEWIDSVKKERFKEFNWDDAIKIQMTTLDKLIEKYGVPKFIKIDVEGYELEVLNGLTNAIDIISFEYTVPEQIQKAKDCISQIEKYNPQIVCNFSINESMQFESDTWQSPTDFKEYISTDAFISTGFGDIYVKSLSTQIS